MEGNFLSIAFSPMTVEFLHNFQQEVLAGQFLFFSGDFSSLRWKCVEAEEGRDGGAVVQDTPQRWGTTEKRTQNGRISIQKEEELPEPVGRATEAEREREMVPVYKSGLGNTGDTSTGQGSGGRVSHPLSASCIASHSCLFFLFELLFTVAIRSSFCSASITIVAVAVWPLLTIKIGGVRVQPSGFAILPLRRRSSIHWLSPDWPSLRRKFVYIRLVFHTGLYLLSPTVNRRSPNKHTWSRISILFVRATWPADRRACSASCRPIFVIISWTLAGEPRFGLNRLFVLFCLFFLHCFGKTTIWRTDQHTMYSRFFSIISRRGVRLLGFSPFFAFFSACLQSWLSVTLRLDDCPFHPGFFSVSFFMLHFYYFQAIEWQSVTIDKPESGIFFYYFHLVRAAWSSVGQQAMTKPNKNDFHIWISAYPLELTGSSDTPAFRWNNSYINKRRKRSLLFFFLLGGEGGGQRTWTPL